MKNGLVAPHSKKSTSTSSSVAAAAFLADEPSNRATQIMEGGPRLVDMNRYNLYNPGASSSSSSSLEEIQAEWTANFKQKVNERNVRVELGVKSSDQLFADTVQVRFKLPRTRQRPGLGIELVEIKGGGGSSVAAAGSADSSAGDRTRSAGLGITLVSGLVPGGAADGLNILPGDSITKVTLIRELRRQKMGSSTSSVSSSVGVLDQQQAIPVVTECLDYDSTVQAILSLPECNDEIYDEHYIVTLKRIRRKPKVTVKLQYPREQNEAETTIELWAGENLRMGMLKRGVKLNDPLAKRFDTKTGGNCGAGGLCRTCAVSIISGADLLNPQRLAEQQMLVDTPRWRLACKGKKNTFSFFCFACLFRRCMSLLYLLPHTFLRWIYCTYLFFFTTAIVGYGMKEGEISIRVNPRQFV
jgi:ferredoxin